MGARIRLYRMVQQYGGGWKLKARDVQVERVPHSIEVGWRMTEREARYLAVHYLQEDFAKQCTGVWDSIAEVE